MFRFATSAKSICLLSCFIISNGYQKVRQGRTTLTSFLSSFARIILRIGSKKDSCADFWDCHSLRASEGQKSQVYYLLRNQLLYVKTNITASACSRGSSSCKLRVISLGWTREFMLNPVIFSRFGRSSAEILKWLTMTICVIWYLTNYEFIPKKYRPTRFVLT